MDGQFAKDPVSLGHVEEAEETGEDEFTMVAAKLLDQRMAMSPIGYFFVNSYMVSRIMYPIGNFSLDQVPNWM